MENVNLKSADDNLVGLLILAVVTICVVYIPKLVKYIRSKHGRS